MGNEKSNSNKLQIFLAIFLLVFFDQLSKCYFLKFWPRVVVGNKGIAFGMFAWDFWAVVSFLLIGLVFYVLLTEKSGKSGVSRRLGLTMIAGGGISNLVDRILRGAVIDFIKIPLWPTTFNLADVFISLGVIILFLSIKSS